MKGLENLIINSDALLPDDFYSSSTLHLAFLPHWFIPVQIKEDNHQSRDLLKMFLHPAALNDPLRDVPLIRRPLLCGIDKEEHFKIIGPINS